MCNGKSGCANHTTFKHGIPKKSELVSKSILSQIERDMSNPTVATISRISQALEENLSDLFSKIEVENNNQIEKSHEMPSISSKDGLCHLTILGAGETVNWLQWYLLTMEKAGELDSSSHGPKTFENLTVLEGEIELQFNEESQIIKKGETYRFLSNTKHLIKNKSKKNYFWCSRIFNFFNYNNQHFIFLLF